MKTYLTFNTRKLIQRIDSKQEFYEIKSDGIMLNITKKYKHKRGSPFSTIFPKEIKISPEVIGLIVGEGYIGRSFVFANSNEKAIDEVLDFLKQFNILPKFYLEISTKDKNDSYIANCVKFWEDHLEIKIKRVRKRDEFNSITKHGTIHILLNNTLFAKLLKEIIKTSKIRIEKNKKHSINYLKGIIAAEGNINVKKSTRCVYMIRISASKKEERDHYKRCLEKAGIRIYCEDMPTISAEGGIRLGWKTTKGRAGAVIISKWENFIKIFELDLLNLHDEKKEKFLKYFLNNKFTKQFLDFEYFLNRKFTMKEAQNHFGFNGRQLNRVLTLYKDGYLSRKKINQKSFSYCLTYKYKELFNKLKAEFNKLNLSQITPLLNSHS